MTILSKSDSLDKKHVNKRKLTELANYYATTDLTIPEIARNLGCTELETANSMKARGWTLERLNRR